MAIAELILVRGRIHSWSWINGLTRGVTAYCWRFPERRRATVKGKLLVERETIGIEHESRCFAGETMSNRREFSNPYPDYHGEKLLDDAGKVTFRVEVCIFFSFSINHDFASPSVVQIRQLAQSCAFVFISVYLQK